MARYRRTSPCKSPIALTMRPYSWLQDCWKMGKAPLLSPLSVLLLLALLPLPPLCVPGPPTRRRRLKSGMIAMTIALFWSTSVFTHMWLRAVWGDHAASIDDRTLSRTTIQQFRGQSSPVPQNPTNQYAPALGSFSSEGIWLAGRCMPFIASCARRRLRNGWSGWFG